MTTIPFKKPRKKRRPSTVTYEGAILKIKELFLDPFMRGLENARYDNDFETAVRHFFNAETRSIDAFRALEPFKMPGERQKECPAIWIPGEGQREVKAGHTMLVRTDDKMPNRIDIEYDEQVFKLTEAQWRVIREKLNQFA